MSEVELPAMTGVEAAIEFDSEEPPAFDERPEAVADESRQPLEREPDDRAAELPVTPAAERSADPCGPDGGDTELVEDVTVRFGPNGARPPAEHEPTAEVERETVHPALILEIVSRHFGLSNVEAWSSGRSPEMVRARHAGYLLLERRYKVPQPTIALIVGKETRAVYQAVRMARSSLNTDPELTAAYEQLWKELPDAKLQAVPADEIAGAQPGTRSAAELDPRIHDVLKAVADDWSVTIEDLRSRKRSAVPARWVVGRLLQQTNAPLEMIREALGRPSAGAAYQLLRMDHPELTGRLDRMQESLSGPLESLTETFAEPEFDRESAERLLITVADYFGLTREDLRDRIGSAHVRLAKRTAVALLGRLELSTSDITSLLGYKSFDTVYKQRRRGLDYVAGFADQIWTAFREGRTFAEPVVRPSAKTAVRRQPPRHRANGPRSRVPERPMVPSADIDRLVLTASNYFGLEVASFADRRSRKLENVFVRAVVYSLLEDEFGLRRRDAAAYFGKATSSVAELLRRQRETLDNNRRVVTEILTAFRAGDTLEERAREIKEERIREALARRKRSDRDERPSREVPEDERQLFDGVKQGDPEALERLQALYGNVPRDVLAEQFGEDAKPALLATAEAALWKSARYFLHHEPFEVWAEKVIRREVTENEIEATYAALAETTPPPRFFEVAGSFYEANKQRAIMRITGRHAEEVREARRAAEGYLETEPPALDGVSMKDRRNVGKLFLKRVESLAKVPYALHRQAAGEYAKPGSEDVGQLPRLTDFSEGQQREFFDLVVEWSVANDPNLAAADTTGDSEAGEQPV